MLQAVAGRDVDAIAVWKLDRLARDTQLSAAIRAHLRKHGVKIVSLHESFDESAQGKLVARVFKSLAEFYSDNLSQDIRRGIKEVGLRGFYPFASPPLAIGSRRSRRDAPPGTGSLRMLCMHRSSVACLSSMRGA